MGNIANDYIPYSLVSRVRQYEKHWLYPENIHTDAPYTLSPITPSH
ncbi:MAG TPA: hypothetical protein V6D25_07740 [Leptolyngbyaceae cyanobacterium]